MGVLDELPEHVWLELLDDQCLVMEVRGWLEWSVYMNCKSNRLSRDQTCDAKCITHAPHAFTCLGSMFKRGSELLLMNAFSLLAAFIVGSFDDSLVPCGAALGCALGYSIF